MQADLEQKLLEIVCGHLGFDTKTYFASAEQLIPTQEFEDGKNETQ